MGELLSQPGMLAKGTQGQLKGKTPSGGYMLLPPEVSPPTLADLGLTKRESAVGQELAA